MRTKEDEGGRMRTKEDEGGLNIQGQIRME